MKNPTVRLAVAAMISLAIASAASAADKQPPAPKNAATDTLSHAFGQSFPNIMRDFIAWNFVQPEESLLLKNGVMFMPIPNPGDNWALDERGKMIGTASMDLQVKPGTKLVLGVLAWIGETYDPELDIPDDMPWAKEQFLPPFGEAIITLDGVELMSFENMERFYYYAPFEETLSYEGTPLVPNDRHAVGAIWVQGIGIVLNPLSAGNHVLTLYSWDAWGGSSDSPGAGWRNTWNITVAPTDK